MTETYIPFLKEFKKPLLNGDKIATSRTKSYGKRGDTFTIFGATFKLVAVIPMQLSYVSTYFHKVEGFETPQGFIDIWKRIHPRAGYRPQQQVFFHLFIRLSERYVDRAAHCVQYPLKTHCHALPTKKEETKMKTEFRVVPDGRGGFKIGIGVGKLFAAKDLQEVIYGMEHYFRQSAPGYSSEPFDYKKHLAHQQKCSCCPLCRGDRTP